MGYRYFLYGLKVRSSFRLPLLKETAFEGKADVTVGKTWLPRPRRFFFRGDARLKRKSGVGYALIRSGHSLRLDIRCDSADGRLCMFLYGTCFPALMGMRGHRNYLHGSCLEKNGKAVLLSGESGAGKSTMAAELLSKGWCFAADDVSFFAAEGDKIRMIPSVPVQKLWLDTKKAYYAENAPAIRMSRSGGKEKYYVPVTEAAVCTCAELALIVNLSVGEGLEMRELSGAEKTAAVEQDLIRVDRSSSFGTSPEGLDAKEIASRTRVISAVRTDAMSDCRHIREKIERSLYE